MQVQISTIQRKNKEYTYVRVVRSTTKNGVKKRKIIKNLGRAKDKKHLEMLKKEAYTYIYSKEGINNSDLLKYKVIKSLYN